MPVLAKVDDRVVLDVEEVGRLQVAVAVGGAGVDRGGLHRGGRGRGGEVLGDGDRALELAEVAADLGDHRVAGDEADLGVAGVEDVGTGGQVGEGGDGGGLGHEVLLAMWGGVWVHT